MHQLSSTVTTSSSYIQYNFNYGNYVPDNEITPNNLVKITANLIKYGLVDIEEIWPHLNPLDSDIEALFQKKMKLNNKNSLISSLKCYVSLFIIICYIDLVIR